MDDIDRFHGHLDECRQCSEEVFNLCPIGVELIEKAATSDSMSRGLMQWNTVLRNSGAK
jgi:hypothetical protein